MASSVAQPLERQIAQIPGVSQMTSTSSLGATAISVQFDLDRNIDAAANDIQAAINAASGQLPKNLPSPPTYRKVNPSDTPILILSVASDVAPITDVDDAAENILAQQISQIAGVVAGARRRPADAVDPHPDRSGQAGREEPAARGRAHADQQRHRRQPQGLASIGAKQSFTIYDNDQLTEPSDWNNVIVAYRNGAPVSDQRHRQGGRRARPTTTQAGLGQRQARRLSRRSSNSPAPTSSRPSRRSSRRSPVLRRRSRPTSTSPSCPTARRPSAPRWTTCSSR